MFEICFFSRNMVMFALKTTIGMSLNYISYLSDSFDIFLFFQEVESKMLDVIYRFEQIVTTFTSLLKEPLLQEYIDESGTVLGLECDKEAMLFDKLQERPWPSIDLLFSNDEEYQRYIADIVQFIAAEINNVQEYSEVNSHFFFFVI